VLFKAWADRSGMYMEIPYLKCKTVKTQMLKEIQNVHMNISLDTDKGCRLLHDKPVLLTGRIPHDKHNRNCLDYNLNLAMSPGRFRCQDGQTDHQP
jgi:hypothetical protein